MSRGFRSRRALSVAFVLAACGDDGERTTQGPTTTAPATTGGPGSTSTGTPTSTEPTSGGTTADTTTTTDALTTDGPSTSTTTMATTTTGETSSTTTSEQTGTSGPDTDSGGGCLDVLPVPAGPDAVLAQEYVGTYFAYDLGPVPKQGGGHLPRLGGLVISPLEPNLLYVVGPSELPEAELHQVFVERGPCGHIVGWAGEATPVLSAPYLDLMANGPKGVVFISHYPTGELSQLIPGQTMLASTIDLEALGVSPIWSPGGLNFVPPGYPDAGMLRIMGYPFMQNQSLMGSWYRATISYNGTSYDVSPVQKTVELEHGPGGFSYIPAGSPLFPEQRIMVTEWLINPRSVSSYAVDAEGDPIPETRKPFFESFDKPWGSYFEPETGDYMFLQWEAQPDHVYIVQGFVPPPPLPG